jgi:hypothetical protein
MRRIRSSIASGRSRSARPESVSTIDDGAPMIDDGSELRRHHDALRRALSVHRRGRVLDIGCGASQTTRDAAALARDGAWPRTRSGTRASTRSRPGSGRQPARRGFRGRPRRALRLPPHAGAADPRLHRAARRGRQLQRVRAVLGPAAPGAGGEGLARGQREGAVAEGLARRAAPGVDPLLRRRAGSRATRGLAGAREQPVGVRDRPRGALQSDRDVHAAARLRARRSWHARGRASPSART